VVRIRRRAALPGDADPRVGAPQERESFDCMSNLSRGLRQKLAADFTIGRLAPAVVEDAADGTRKLLFRLPGERPAASRACSSRRFDRADGARDRLTLCISSQAGCAMGCVFCATARMNLVRNLTPGEIVGQVRAGRALAAPRGLTNVVFMGMASRSRTTRRSGPRSRR